MVKIDAEKVKNTLPARNPYTSKRDYGKVLVISGSRNYVGAPFFASQSAVNTGSGLVFLAHPESLYPILASKLNEVIFKPIREDALGAISTSSAEKISEETKNYDVCLAGPGLGLAQGTFRLAKCLLTRSEVPIVLDADALNVLAGNTHLLKRSKTPVIITPHEGEMKRLCPEFTHETRLEDAVNFSKENGCITVLKGYETITALPDGRVYINTTGNPGMSKGGSGDVLSGIIASLVGQGIEPGKAAYIGVWLHGRAGDLCADALGEYGMTPTDMLEYIKHALKEL